MMLEILIKKLNKNKFFKFISSVRLAVPIMLVIGAVVAWGTIVESNYNADIAGLMVYRTLWFYALLGLLGINIFCAMMSRYPWKLHQIGFVTTHIGMLTLLGGALVTSEFGLDGQLRVEEGSQSSNVILQNYVVEVRNESGEIIRSTPLTRKLSEKTADDLGLESALEGSGYRVVEYRPFVKPGMPSNSGWQNSQSAGAEDSSGIQFRLKSQFFDVTEGVGPSKPEMSMGPVSIRYIVAGKSAAPSKQSKSPHQAPSGTFDPKLVIKTSAGKILATLDITKERSIVLENGVKVSVSGIFEQGVVVQNKLQEGGEPGANPALELKIEKASKSIRDVAYAKFPDFSLSTNGSMGLKFEYQVSGGSSSNTAVDSAADKTIAAPTINTDRSGNVMEFHVPQDSNESVELVLYKDNEKLLSEKLSPSKAVVTPWMGMEITLMSRNSGGGSPSTTLDHSANNSSDNSMESMHGNNSNRDSNNSDVVSAELLPRSPVPPSAILINPLRSELGQPFWLVEGSSARVEGPQGIFEIFYGQAVVELPLLIHLNKFTKVDYPGTETPKSYESLVHTGDGQEILISMNEPLQKSGYVIYQAAYDLQPGRPPVSIFSVNRDPGRPIKYAGSLILVLGIALYTLMKSRVYRNWKKVKSV